MKSIDLQSELRPAWRKVLAQDILGSSDPVRISSFVRGVCSTLEIHRFECVGFEISVGAVFLIESELGGRVVLKVMSPDVGIDDAIARYRYQLYLKAADFPCPEPLVEPMECEGLVVVAEEHLVTGEPANSHKLEDRTLMAHGLSEIVERSSGYDSLLSFPDNTLVHVVGQLWPKPHNVLFDFERNPKRAKWIDDIGLENKPDWENSVSRHLIGHLDWSAKHCRISKGKLSAVYDWDSTARVPETRTIGVAASSFVYTNDNSGGKQTPSLYELASFLELYENARGVSLTKQELKEITQNIYYSAAYAARCEDANDYGTPGTTHAARRFLESICESDLYRFIV